MHTHCTHVQRTRSAGRPNGRTDGRKGATMNARQFHLHTSMKVYDTTTRVAYLYTYNLRVSSSSAHARALSLSLLTNIRYMVKFALKHFLHTCMYSRQQHALLGRINVLCASDVRDQARILHIRIGRLVAWSHDCDDNVYDDCSGGSRTIQCVRETKCACVCVCLATTDGEH